MNGHKTDIKVNLTQRLTKGWMKEKNEKWMIYNE